VNIPPRPNDQQSMSSSFKSGSNDAGGTRRRSPQASDDEDQNGNLMMTQRKKRPQSAPDEKKSHSKTKKSIPDNSKSLLIQTFSQNSSIPFSIAMNQTPPSNQIQKIELSPLCHSILCTPPQPPLPTQPQPPQPLFSLINLQPNETKSSEKKPRSKPRRPNSAKMFKETNYTLPPHPHGKLVQIKSELESELPQPTDTTEAISSSQPSQQQWRFHFQGIPGQKVTKSSSTQQQQTQSVQLPITLIQPKNLQETIHQPQIQPQLVQVLRQSQTQPDLQSSATIVDPTVFLHKQIQEHSDPLMFPDNSTFQFSQMQEELPNPSNPSNPSNPPNPSNPASPTAMGKIVPTFHMKHCSFLRKTTK